MKQFRKDLALAHQTGSFEGVWAFIARVQKH